MRRGNSHKDGCFLFIIDNFDNLLFIYTRFAQSENKSQRHIEGVKSDVLKFDEFLGGSTDVKQVKAEDLRDYIRYLQSKPKWLGHPSIKQEHGLLSSNSVASKVRNIRSFWSWLYKEHFIEENPFSNVKPPKATAREAVPLSPEEVSLLIKAIPLKDHRGYRDACISALLYGLGSRVTETLNILEQNIHFDTGLIIVLGKGNKERPLYMTSKVFKGLYKYHSLHRPKVISNYFFIHSDGRPLSRTYFEHRMQEFVKTAGITSTCTPHILRYSFAIQFLRNGGDELTLQNILGHSTLEMTHRYVKLANSDIESKLKQYSPAESLDINF
jgi:site-specific recombinase XerD